MQCYRPARRQSAAATAVAALCAAILYTTPGARAGEPLPLVPWPKQVEVRGEATLPATLRIVAEDKALLPLAEVLAGEIGQLGGPRPAVVRGSPGRGDIGLQLDPKLKADRQWFTQTLEVTDRAFVRGEDAAAVAQGTASLLQLLQWNGKEHRLPAVRMKDGSVAPYTGAMLDVARQRNTVDHIKDVIVLCRLYKARYLHIHFTDDQMWTLPSKAFPKLGLYKEPEIRELVAFAEARGVTIIPEIESAGHSTALRGAYPEVFGSTGLNVINMAGERTYAGFEKIIDELADLFPAAPWIHIGCDEAYLAPLAADPAAQEYMRDRNIKSVHDLYAIHIRRLDEMIRKHGRKTIVWQDAPLTDVVPKEVAVMVWHINWNHGAAPDYNKQGRDVIQVTWTPCVYQTVKEVYSWSPYNEELPPGGHNLGSQMLLWERPGEEGLRKLRWKVPPRNEITHGGPAVQRDYADFAARLRETDRLLDTLLTGVRVTEAPDPVTKWLNAGGACDGESSPTLFMLDPPFSVSLSAAGGAVIRYTLDGSEASTNAPRYERPFTIPEAKGFESAPLKIAAEGQARPFFREYRYKPFDVEVSGTVGPGDLRFGRVARVTPKNVAPGLTVRYQFGGPVTEKSPAASGPIAVRGESRLALRCFGSDGVPRGVIWQEDFKRVDFDPDCVTRGKPVEATRGDRGEWKYAVDGVVDPERGASVHPGTNDFTIALGEPMDISRVTLFTPWNDAEACRHIVEISADGKDWKTVADASGSAEPATQRGYRHDFAPARAAFIRVRILADRGSRLLEVRAYGPQHPDPAGAGASDIPKDFAASESTRRWTGGEDIYWSNARNWDSAPAAGDTIALDKDGANIELESDRAIGGLLVTAAGLCLDAPALAGMNCLHFARDGKLMAGSGHPASRVYCDLAFPSQALIETSASEAPLQIFGRMHGSRGLLIRPAGERTPRSGVALNGDSRRTLSGPVELRDVSVVAGSDGAFGNADAIVLRGASLLSGVQTYTTLKCPPVQIPPGSDGKTNLVTLGAVNFDGFDCPVRIDRGAYVTLSTGGNEIHMDGPISGDGDLHCVASAEYMRRSIQFHGKEANALSGTMYVERGSIALGKPAGTAAHSGPIVATGGSAIYWRANEQLPDGTAMTLGENAGLDLDDFSETAGTLTLRGDAWIDLGRKTKGTQYSGVIRFADSHAARWAEGGKLTIKNWDGKRNCVAFGATAGGLTPGQVDAVVFENPAGRPEGLYRAEIDVHGVVMPRGR